VDRLESRLQSVKSKVADRYFREVGLDEDQAYRLEEVKGRIKLAKERRAGVGHVLVLIRKENAMLQIEAGRVAKEYNLWKDENCREESDSRNYMKY
jgi:hypothetical protein